MQIVQQPFGSDKTVLILLQQNESNAQTRNMVKNGQVRKALKGEAGAWSNQVNRRLIHWAYIQFAIDQLLAGSLIV